KISHGLLFARSFTMEIDDNRIHARSQRAGGQFAFDRGKWIVKRIHEDTAHGINDKRALAVLCVNQRGTPARSSIGIVERPDQPRRPLNEHQSLALIPGVIAQSDRICAGIDELVVDNLGDTEAPSGVLAIYYDQIQLPLLDKAGQPFDHDRASGTTDNVADKKYAHAISGLAVIDNLMLS